MFCWLLYGWILCVQASETVLRYTTDLTDQPSVQVELLGSNISVKPKMVVQRPVFTEWEVRWDNQDAWVQHLHIHHDGVDNALSTILMGPQQNGQIHLLNDYQKSRQQILSDSGEIQDVIEKESSSIMKHLLWFWMVLVLLFVIRRTKKYEGIDSDNDTSVMKPWQSGVLFLFASLFWQRSMFSSSGIPAQYHDALGTYWMLVQSSTWDLLFDPLTVYPVGADYRSLDSFVLWMVSRALVWLDPIWIYRGCLIVFPAVSAWSAEWWAREIGIRTPWSLLAGMLFGFSGLMDNAILEGQVYQCLTAGLPLTGVFVLKYLRTPSFKTWLGIVVSFALSLFSSSYIGASCLIVLLGLWLGTGAWRKLASLWVFLGVLPVLWLHNDLMSTAGIHQVRELREMVIGSVSLINFWGSTPEMDREGHAIALGISVVGLILALGVRKEGVSKGVWQSLLWMGGISACLMVGPSLNLSHLDTVLSLPNQWLFQQPGFSSIGFPIRLSHPFLLMIALFAALCGQQMARKHRWVWLILPLVWADIERRQLSSRQGMWDINGPVFSSVEPYESIFTLYPLAYKRIKGSDADIILYMMDCLAQTTHKRPIANNCLSVNIHESTVKDLQRDLLDNILNKESILGLLNQNQMDVLVLYPELFSKTDRIRVQNALSQEMEMIEEGAEPLWYQVYKPSNSIEKSSSFSPSDITIDLITSKDESKPLLIIGDGVLTESSVRIRAQTVVHSVELTSSLSSISLLFQNSEGEVVWEGTLNPNSEQDHFIVRPSMGAQMELPIFNSPPALSNDRQWIWLLFGSVVGVLFSRRRASQNI